jgi:uncharacterized protein YkwD
MKTYSRSIFAILVLLLVNSCSSPSSPPKSQGPTAPIVISKSTSEIEQRIFDLVNNYRSSHRLPSLKWNEVVAEQARIHSNEMMRSGKLDHRDFDHRIEVIHLPYSAAAENVASYRGNQEPAAFMVEGWIHSSTHRNNIEGAFDLTGLGVVRDREGKFFATQIFLNGK